MFKKIEIEGWRQFEQINIEFDNNVTILTGANGAGKTSLLGILSKHYGWEHSYVSNFAEEKKGFFKYIPDIRRLFKSINPNSYYNTSYDMIGKIKYDGGRESNLGVPKNVSQVYNVNVIEMQGVKGLHIPSHRSIPVYRQVQNLALAPKKKEDIYRDH